MRQISARTNFVVGYENSFPLQLFGSDVFVIFCMTAGLYSCQFVLFVIIYRLEE